MLNISSKQFQSLHEKSSERFKARAAEYLKKSYPNAHVTSDEALLTRFISAAIDKAAAYDITHEIDVIRFFHIFFAVGGNFEVFPDYAWIVDYLREPIRAELRLDYICERLRFGIAESQ